MPAIAPITPSQETTLRSSGQASRLFLLLGTPNVVFACRVNQLFTTTDAIAEVIYDGASGTLANVKPDMTVLVGSTAGGHDLGLCRIRKTPTASVLYLGETSEIAWDNNLYLTVVDDFDLWPRHLVTDDPGDTKMDYDVDYSDQHADQDPVVVLGPPRVVILDGASVDVDLDALLSYAPGSTISGYAFGSFSGTWTNPNTATPTLTLSATGEYLYWCTVTAANGKTWTGYRKVYVIADPDLAADSGAIIPGVSNSFESGMVEFSGTLLDADLVAAARVRTVAIVFSIGPDPMGQIAGCENIITWGWLSSLGSGSTPDRSAPVGFGAAGPAWWLGQIPAYPFGMRDSEDVPTDWIYFQDLTIDKAAWHLLHWRSTVTRMVDIFLSGDTRQAPAVEAQADLSLWDQLREITRAYILAWPLTDRFGRLFVQMDTIYLEDADLTGITTVRTLTSQDWSSFSFQERLLPAISRSLVMGVRYTSIKEQEPVGAWSAGKVYRNFGRPAVLDRLLLESWDHALFIAGRHSAYENAKVAGVIIGLASADRMLDLAPNQLFNVTIAAEENSLGLAWTNQKCVPRRIQWAFAPDGAVQVTVEAVPMPGTDISIRYEFPRPIKPNDPIIPAPNYPTWPGGGLYPPVVPIDPGIIGKDQCVTNYSADPNGPFTAGIRGTKYSNDPESAFGRLMATCRSSSHVHGTRYAIDAVWEKWNPVTEAWDVTWETDWYQIYLIDSSGTRVATGTKDPLSDPYYRTGAFSPPVPVRIEGIEIALTLDNVPAAESAAVIMYSYYYTSWVTDLFISQLAQVDNKIIVTSTIAEVASTNSVVGPSFDAGVAVGFPDPLPTSIWWDYEIIYSIINHAEVGTRAARVTGAPPPINLGWGTTPGEESPVSGTFQSFQNDLWIKAGSQILGWPIPQPNIQYGIQVVFTPHPNYRIRFRDVLLWNLCP